MKTCTKCAARLPLRFFPLINGKHTAACAPCRNTERRLHDPLRPLRRDPLQVRLNNLTNLWHGPVRRVPLRSHA
ncbi:TPA: hypothetical protein ACOFD0_001279 [Stenotrophomonas maltophilia]|jgi:hypothetical protein|uniref:hypothetical protein n=1 Tax=Stenotrophomonas maltophilia TaxID=40324 RepID=UPI000C259EAC|nr:hypothetical protein [Stenotrophomonas maltophilia]MCF3482603.1 hypothetical protein [Stenotrophomonas maltophilia]MCU1114362.1 hypothetical protein [Stenotrophomonas maltophilia]PJL16690.1 hypothetical protein B9Y71_14600 [Stenotrophomonas maltophilia]PJL34908.1 hypothetical protein B9Y80_12650 [Stenotrophomonas maltophilia]QGM11139.1 hypothetical protein FEO84_18145 [Stenotrophomonas maltophilia]